MSDHNLSYYLKCLCGGALACGLTHTAVVPLDIVKCRAQVLSSRLFFAQLTKFFSQNQVDPKEYPSLGAGFSKTYSVEGPKGLTIVKYPQ